MVQKEGPLRASIVSLLKLGLICFCMEAAIWLCLKICYPYVNALCASKSWSEGDGQRERERENILWVNLPFSVTSCDPNCRRIADPVAGRRCCDKQPLDLEHLGTFNDIDIVFLRNVD